MNDADSFELAESYEIRLKYWGKLNKNDFFKCPICGETHGIANCKIQIVKGERINIDSKYMGHGWREIKKTYKAYPVMICEKCEKKETLWLYITILIFNIIIPLVFAIYLHQAGRNGFGDTFFGFTLLGSLLVWLISKATGAYYGDIDLKHAAECRALPQQHEPDYKSFMFLGSIDPNDL